MHSTITIAGITVALISDSSSSHSDAHSHARPRPRIHQHQHQQADIKALLYAPLLNPFWNNCDPTSLPQQNGHEDQHLGSAPPDYELQLHIRTQKIPAQASAVTLSINHSKNGELLHLRDDETFVLELNTGTKRGTLHLVTWPNEEIYPVAGLGLFCALRAFFSTLLPLFHGGLMLHGAGLMATTTAQQPKGMDVKSKAGVLCLGESGAGKSTLAKFWQKHRGDQSILGDELVAVRKDDKNDKDDKDAWQLYATPFSYSVECPIKPQHAPLRLLLSLHHGAINQVAINSPPLLVNLLSACLAFPMAQPPLLQLAHQMIFTLLADSTSTTRAQQLPYGKLVFSLAAHGKDACDAIDNVL